MLVEMCVGTDLRRRPPSENKHIIPITRNELILFLRSQITVKYITLYCSLSSNTDSANYTNSILISNYVKLK